MKRLFVAIVIILFLFSYHKKSDKVQLAIEQFPSEWFYLQKNYPDFKLDHRAYHQAMESVSYQNGMHYKTTSNGFNANWTLEGPGNIGGRINTIAVDPGNDSIIYVGNASGGIFKTTDGGNSWFSIFDDQAYLAIGHIAIDPSNANIIYAGTGDPNLTFRTHLGNGIYKSTDAGATWTNLGLAMESIISKIIVDPTDSNIVYAATMGLPSEKNIFRGLYKSIDGGNSWNNILFISDSAGVIDILLDPTNPQIIYAAGWNSMSGNSMTINVLRSGPDAKIYKSVDGGANWTVLSGGLPTGNMSRIGLAMSGTNPNVLYALYVGSDQHFEGIYKSIDAGVSWGAIPTASLPSFTLYYGFGWYFGKIAVNPADDNEIFVLGVDLYKTTNGGVSWTLAAPEWWFYDVHADKHDLLYLNSTTILLATDGGLYKTTIGGGANLGDWEDIENIPNTQFYRVAVNPHDTVNYYGGTQDNGTTSGSSDSINLWERVYGGDGFTAIFHPSNPNIYYVESQGGSIMYTDDGGSSYQGATSGIPFSDRKNWDMPYIMSNDNPGLLYAGTHRIYKHNGAPWGIWQAISGDLTDGNIWGATISTIAESPLNGNYLYAGTSDANVWRSLDGGNNWQNITGILPNRYVTSIKASPRKDSVVYVTHSGYSYNDFIPHVHQSTDNGTTWQDISANLPQVAVNDILIYPLNDSLLFVATDAGVYASLDGGVGWTRLGSNMPIIPVFDLEFDPKHRKLIAGTHARSMMSYPIDSIGISIDTITIDTTGLAQTLIMNSINLFPNPAEEYIMVNFPKNSEITLFDINGRKVSLTPDLSQRLIKVPLDGLEKGIYIISIRSQQAEFIGKFLKL